MDEKKRSGKIPKDQEIHFRLSKDELAALEMACYVTEKSKSDILRKGLQMYLSGIKGSY